MEPQEKAAIRLLALVILIVLHGGVGWSIIWHIARAKQAYWFGDRRTRRRMLAGVGLSVCGAVLTWFVFAYIWIVVTW